MRFSVAGGLAQVFARQGVKSWRAWVAQRLVPTSVRHVCLMVLAGKYRTEGEEMTYKAEWDVLLGEDCLDSESGDEKGESHCGQSWGFVSVVSVKSVGGLKERMVSSRVSDEADGKMRRKD
jgi:hypothetical protein